MNKLKHWIHSFTAVSLVCTSAASLAGGTLPKDMLADLLGIPQVTHLAAASQTATLAYLQSDQGVSNIYVASDGSNARAITSYREDDGQAIGQLTVDANGRWVAWVRGGAPNKEGLNPNPAAVADGVERAIWIAAISPDKPAPIRVGLGTAPAFNADANQLAYLSGGKLFIVSPAKLDPKDDAQKPAFTLQGKVSRLSWSPDGKQIAFVSDRDDHSFIGVFELATRKISWMAPSPDRDNSPAWSPDSKCIAFIRIAGLRNGAHDDEIDQLPFTVWVAHIDTGQAKQIWQSPGKDYPQWTEYDLPGTQLRWAPASRLTFYSEHEDWLHVYSISANGSNLRTLTPGNCEVQNSALSPDGKSLVFSSNCGDIDRRHIWEVSVERGAPKSITRGEGIETDPVFAGKNVLAWRASTAQAPMHVSIRNERGVHDYDRNGHTLTGCANCAERWSETAKHLVTPKSVVFDSTDGFKIHAQLFSNSSNKRQPALIYVHGGPIRQMLPGWHYMGYYHNAYAMNQYLASHGYRVLSINYRSGIGYGRAFRQAANQGYRGASEYQDVLAAAKYLQGRNDVDTKHIGIWGGSYGGYLTALALARNSDIFAAGVDFHGVHNWAALTDESLNLVDDAAKKLAFDSSPTANIKTWRSPVLLIHGDDDPNVEFNQTTDLLQQLREQHVHTETLIFPGETHFFLREATWLQSLRATAEFFDRQFGVKH